MLALWKHLKPAPYPHGSQVLRILGKLAGRGRDFLQLPFKVKNEELLHSGVKTVITFEPNVNITLTLDRSILLAKQKLSTYPDIEVKKQAFKFLKVCLDSIMQNCLREPTKENNSMSSSRRIEASSTRFRVLLESIFIAASIEKLQETVGEYFQNLCTHFAIVLVSLTRKTSSGTSSILELTLSVFLEALMESLCAENRTCSTSALKALDTIIAISSSLCGSLDAASACFGEISRRICHCCYRQEWYYKSGGCMGISYLNSKMPAHWIGNQQVSFVKALLFVLKDLSPEVSVVTVEEASETLKRVLMKCNTPNEDSDNNNDIARYRSIRSTTSEVVGLLALELSSANPIVRSEVQNSLLLLSDLTGTKMTELLEPFKAALLNPIFTKPLRSLAVLVQTGYIDALTFCLNLRPNFVSFSPELIRLLQGALTIAEKDDISSTKTITQKSLQLLTSLRMVCIELLSAAMASPDFQGAEHQEFRNRIIGVFFKALTLRSKEIVHVSKKGLAQVIAHQKLPKELLQTSLRPVLLNLADYRKLSVPLLQGLSRLLELLTNCFNVTLGEKLLEHLNKWTEPQKIAATKIWKDGEETKIAASIIDIFHLLPPAAGKFLESLVALTIQLEQQLPREVSSPYRAPLIKFLNRYPVESVEFFLQRLSQPPCSKLFRFLIREDIATSLREELAKNPQRLINATFHFNNQSPPIEVQFQGILIVRTLAKFLPEWLSQNRPVLDCLIQIWQTAGRLSRVVDDESLPLYHVREPKLLIKCFLNYCKNHREEVDLLFYMLSIFTIRTTIDYTFLKDYYQQEVAENYSQAKRRPFSTAFCNSSETIPSRKITKCNRSKR